MKRIVSLIIALVAITCCTKIDQTEKTNEDLIIGEWSFVKGTSINITMGGTQGTAGTDEKLLRFQNDGLLYVNGTRVYKYTINKTSFTREQIGGQGNRAEFEIIKLDKEELVYSCFVGGGVVDKSKVTYYYQKVK